MASRGKKKTTMAKLNRENKLAERRMEKQMRKDARKQETPEDEQTIDGFRIGPPNQMPVSEDELAAVLGEERQAS